MRRLILVMALALLAGACGDDDAVPPGELITGEDEVLAALESGCEAGDYVMCDVLYFATPLGSDLEAFADTCGNRTDGGTYCAEEFDVDIDFSQLESQCSGGDMLACDQMFMYSGEGSGAEDFGRSCGGVGRDASTCVVAHGLISR